MTAPPQREQSATHRRERRAAPRVRRQLARHRWRWVLALCAVYVALALWIALPGGGRLQDRSLWDHPSTQAQFRAWATLLSRFGFEADADSLRERTWSWTQRYVELRRKWVWPVHEVALQLGIDQSFRMFSNPQTVPSLLVVELDRGAGFEPIYVARSSEHRWNARQLEHHRIRKVVGRVARGGYEAQWRALTRWLARRASCDFSDGERLRVRLYRSRTEIVDPGSASSPRNVAPPVPESYTRTHSAGRFTRARTLRLDKHRCDG